MKQNRLLLATIFVIMYLLCGCGFLGDQRYVCNADDIMTIQIVKLDQYVEGEYRYEYTVLCEIQDNFVFAERLNNINHTVNWGEPGQLDIEYVVIKIDYINGDYDLLYTNAQWLHRSGVNHYGYFFFDEYQFQMLIDEYMGETTMHAKG